MDPLATFKDQLRQNAELADPTTAKPQGLCIACGEPAIPKCYSNAGRREYHISGMCELCFDNCTEEIE